MKRKYRYDKIRLFRLGNLEVWWWKKFFYKDAEQAMKELATQSDYLENKPKTK